MLDTGQDIRSDWTVDEVEALMRLPLLDLVGRANVIHRTYHDPNDIQKASLLSIKTGSCPEDCAYCPQSAHHREVELTKEKLMNPAHVISLAKRARDAGAERFCMGAAWRQVRDGEEFDNVLDMVRGVRDLDMEACVTLGMLKPHQAKRLAEAGLTAYNHNLDTSPEFYGDIITTRTYQDRLDTLANVRNAGMKVCCGGIVGMGETESDRIGLLLQLANLPQHPESVPINLLVKVAGTPLADTDDLDPFDFIRTIAVARIMMPESHVRLSAGREQMNDQLQALAFFAGANSIFYGEKLLTTGNPQADKDKQLFKRLGIEAERYTDNSVDQPNVSTPFYNAAEAQAAITT